MIPIYVKICLFEKRTMDYRTENTQPNNTPYGQPGQFLHNPGQGMATAAMLLGLASLFTLFTVYLPMVLGSIAIILAILSKGYGKKMISSAKIGVITSICGLSLILSITAALVGFFLSSDRSTLVQIGQMMDAQTGDMAENLLGTSYEAMMEEYADMLGK